MGDTFLLDPLATGGMHLWIVIAISHTSLDQPTAFIVNVTTPKPRSNGLCTLSANDPNAHQFITHDSIVYFQCIMEFDDSYFEGKRRLDPIQPQLLLEIQRKAIVAKGVRAKLISILSRIVS